MRRAILLAIFTPALGCAGATKAEWSAVVVAGETVQVESKGKRLGYVPLALGNRLATPVTGPCEARIYLRLLLPEGQTEKVEYGVEISVDGAAPKRKSYKASPDRDARPVGRTDAVGDRDSTDVKVPAGRHDVQVAYTSGPPGLLLVMIRTRPAGKR